MINALEYTNKKKGFGVSELIIFVLAFGPTLIFYLGYGSSMALGTALVSLITLIIFQIRFPLVMKKKLMTGILIAVISIMLLMINLGLSAIFLPIDYERSILSFLILFLIIITGYLLGIILNKENQVFINQAIFHICWLFLLFGFIAAIGLKPPDSFAYFKPVFPFTEPSHYAIAALPFMMYCLVRGNLYKKIIILLIVFTIIVLLKSLTLAIGIFLASVVFMRVKYIVLLMPLIAMIVMNTDYSYYIERIDFSDENLNLSSLVYKQGWQLIEESFLESRGIGLGYQQLGINGTSTAASEAIWKQIYSNLNLLDGGFLFSKIISELGFFGLLVTTFYLYLTMMAMKSLRQTSQGRINPTPIVTFSNSILVSYLIELFVRGQGYFSGTAVMLVAALTVLWVSRKLNYSDKTVLLTRHNSTRS